MAYQRELIFDIAQLLLDVGNIFFRDAQVFPGQKLKDDETQFQRVANLAVVKVNTAIMEEEAHVGMCKL